HTRNKSHVVAYDGQDRKLFFNMEMVKVISFKFPLKFILNRFARLSNLMRKYGKTNAVFGGSLGDQHNIDSGICQTTEQPGSRTRDTNHAISLQGQQSHITDGGYSFDGMFIQFYLGRNESSFMFRVHAILNQ